MSVVVIGLNQRSVPLDVFERVAISDDQVGKVLHDLTQSPDVAEAVVLSTCNRIEIYARAERFHPAFGDVRDALARHSGVPLDTFADHLYVHHDDDAARHLFGVTCGLDSAVLGETEILGQVRRAHEVARDAEAAGAALSDLFTASSSVGRKVRAQTGIARNITSVSRAAVAMATAQLGTLDGRSICVLGAGEMSEGMAVALRDAGARELIISNRTIERAEPLAERVGGVVAPLDELSSTVARVDVLLTGTGANSLMVEHQTLVEIMSARTDRPLLIVDIAVPRDVDPAAGEIDGVTLLDMEDLSAFAEVGRAERRGEIAAVRSLIDDEVDRYQATALGRAVEPLVAGFRQEVEAIRQAELERVGAPLSDDARDAVDAATRAVLNRLLHRPTSELRDAAGTARGERLAESFRELFGIDLDDA
ncbi:MAG: glutamyl-tRNA reductase [Acidimicrobiales bacterium]